MQRKDQLLLMKYESVKLLTFSFLSSFGLCFLQIGDFATSILFLSRYPPTSEANCSVRVIWRFSKWITYIYNWLGFGARCPDQ